MTSRAAAMGQSAEHDEEAVELGRPIEPAAFVPSPPPSSLEPIEFSVDAALLQELGERLVGRAHIALAELIKNSYDADATRVVLSFGIDEIVVADNGHGMDDEQFRNYWMRIGSAHKDQRRSSPAGRRMTGSKGVGRLSAQFLADKIALTTRAVGHPTLYAEVDWRAAVRARELTNAKALWTHVSDTAFVANSISGTTLRLTELKQEWDADALRELAQELWPLQPPYATADHAEDNFQVELRTPDPDAELTFGRQMHAVLELWTARITGSVRRTGRNAHLQVRIQFRDDEVVNLESSISRAGIDDAEFEIRVFDLKRRQPFGIRVEEARSYLNRFGGVHVYDAGFHLPYYGPDVDWLGIEQDHSHRLSRSELLPEHLQVAGGLSFLPTNSRLYGVVRIDTGAERRSAQSHDGDTAEALSIQISRDRLIDNRAYRQLRNAVRWAIDAYAMQEARRRWQEFAEADTGDEVPLDERAARIEEVLDRYGPQIPEPVLADLRKAVSEVTHRAESEAERNARQAGLLGSLATAGISAIALEHETARQTAELTRLARRVRERARALDDDELRDVAARLTTWAETVKATRQLFTPYMDQESREDVKRLPARGVIERTVDQSRVLLRNVKIELDVPAELRLPPGRFVEWTSIFQNLLVNAANATLDSSTRLIAVSSSGTNSSGEIRIQDTGAGVDLKHAEELFAPFARRQQISAERRSLGAGGTGLGLTIVRMIARNLNCLVGFVEPDDDFSTAVRLSWRSL